MKRWILRSVVLLAVLVAFPYRSPAPWIYTPGEGWSYEREGRGAWTRTRAKDQLDVAQEAYDQEDYNLALKAARRTARRWPLSDYAPPAQFMIARCYEAEGKDERAFKEYQRLLEKYPKIENYEEVLERQFEIANRYLDGQWFKLWGYVPSFPSMKKTAEMYRQILDSGIYSKVAPRAQMSIGTAFEKKSDYAEAVQAYEKAADLYHDKAQIAADALYQAGQAYTKQAKTAEYDQNAATKAIETFRAFSELYPQDPRVSEVQNLIADLRNEQAKGALVVAQFYEKRRQWEGARVYYNEVVNRAPDSEYAEEAKSRIEELRKRIEEEKQTAQK